MKKNKFNLDWKRVLLGMALCLALVAFVGSMAQGNQAEAQKGITTQKNRIETQPGTIRKMATMNDVLAKCELIDQRILILEGKINVVQERCDQVHAMVERMERSGK